jgi:hypothetical protein
MAYIYTWNSAFEAKPADIDNISDGAAEIRKFKVAVRERLATNHYFDTAGTDADHGEHTYITLREQSSKPTAAANKGYMYTKEVSGKAELFWEDEDGNEIQFTSAGAPSTTMQFPSGTKMVFYQDTAPIGWTIQNTLDDKLLYVTKGSAAGGETGGGVHSGGTWTLAGTVTVANHTLTTDEIPAHTHAWSQAYYHADSDGSPFGQGDPTDQTGSATITPASVGGGQGHNHTATLGGSSWRPAAYCVIIAAKV